MKQPAVRRMTWLLTFASTVFLLFIWLRFSWTPMLFLPQDSDMAMSIPPITPTRSGTSISDDEISSDNIESRGSEYADVAATQDLVRTWKGRIYALGDLHGDLHNTMMLLISVGLTDWNGNWKGGDSLLIQTGDIADRGPNALPLYSLFQALSLQAPLSKGRVVQLLGNHESLLLCGMYQYLHPLELREHYKGSFQYLAQEWSPSGSLGRHIRESFHVMLVVNDILFVHAGLLPMHAGASHEKLRQQLWEHIDANQCGTPPAETGWDLLGESSPLWTRALAELPEKDACAMLRKTLNKAGANRMVVGHTPTLSKSIETRCDNRLIMIDTGLSRFLFDRPTVLQIHNGTFVEHYYDHLEVAASTERNETFIPATPRERKLFSELSHEETKAWLNQDKMEVELFHGGASTASEEMQVSGEL